MRDNSHVSLASFNCRGLKKVLTNSGCSFSQILRSVPYDLLALQETHASTEQLQNSFNMILQASDSNWTHHCGLISFNPSLSLLPLWSSIDGRILATTVTHNSNLFEPLTIYVIYASATSTARLNLCETNQLFQFHQTPEGRCILMGDFNHNIHKSIRSDRAVEWQHWIHRF
ncbi:hypothetical protein G6F57_009971 [Rhizopus arrhizus]|uniref:Endonuclease/exonuclease/phosphatase domain-containing protein n=1 Tax=Rhizopus oryzae TaxID=64495 RepID=A0A9P6X2J5_RHIOR|nr:hypothetical protein G6F23_005698 [Rhizopus arrhizus]KAG0758341.1 hypothetical protein G6F24_009865 [Rhizopus arrhizus]KAG0781632.1 hypothetical protein G6F21_011545 [Rhizopus arrhizus]KAG0798982.1 hypothetical protein G6F22_003685 [Rhizopus arrhizus]KAG0807500.1 hypothetical protein G6F20_010317 [Rhizopus arrhizus]